MARAPSSVSGQPGNALSLEGGFIQAQSSSYDVVTIQAHASQAGDLLNLSSYKAAATDASGEFMTDGASGQVWMQRPWPLVAIASNSTAYTVLSSNSGKIHIIPGFSSGAKVTLPAHSSGLYYKFIIKAVTASGGLTIAPPSTPGTIVHGAVTDGGSIVAGTAADLIGGASFELISDGTNWYMTYSGAGATASELITVAAT